MGLARPAAPDPKDAKDTVTLRTPEKPADAPARERGGLLDTLGHYIALTKPRIIELLLVTTFPVMFLAQRGLPSWLLVVNTLLGGTLAAASANVFNCYLDRDIDARMLRTANRPLVSGAVSGRGALLFASVLGVGSVLYLGFLVNWLSAVLALAAIALYVLFYTMLLKRRTSQNIVWGGVAGCMPVLIGWAAVRESVSWTAVLLFLIVFFWTPPHYWPLSMKFRDDYARAGVPMLPVVAHNTKVARHIVIYAWVTVLASLAVVPVAPMGWVYLVTALVAGGAFILEAHLLLGRAKAGIPDAKLKAMRLFHYSITYLTLVFAGVAVDPFLYVRIPGLG